MERDFFGHAEANYLHCFYPSLQKILDLPVLHILKQACDLSLLKLFL